MSRSLLLLSSVAFLLSPACGYNPHFKTVDGASSEAAVVSSGTGGVSSGGGSSGSSDVNLPGTGGGAGEDGAPSSDAPDATSPGTGGVQGMGGLQGTGRGGTEGTGGAEGTGGVQGTGGATFADGGRSDVQPDVPRLDAPRLDVPTAIDVPFFADVPRLDAPKLDVPTDAPTPVPNIIFVTSTTQTPALGGLAGADALCAQRAQAAKLPGTYKAWLSTRTLDARTKLGTASGWVRVDGRPVFGTLEDARLGRLLYPPRLDEFGVDVGDASAFTATMPNGEAWSGTDFGTCIDFTSAVDGSPLMGGSTSGLSDRFTLGGILTCSTAGRIYCLGADRMAQVSVTPAVGRYAFTTSGAWKPGGGVTSADELCKSEASMAGLPGSYKALLAASGASAASRFSTNGLPWIRPDGIPLRPTASDTFTATYWDSSPNPSANGLSFPGGGMGTWTGAATMTAPGTPSTTCQDWLSSSESDGAYLGEIAQTSTARFFGSTPPLPGGVGCSGTWQLTCFQE
jgi:hypothetical protein